MERSRGVAKGRDTRLKAHQVLCKLSNRRSSNNGRRDEISRVAVGDRCEGKGVKGRVWNSRLCERERESAIRDETRDGDGGAEVICGDKHGDDTR